MLDIVTTIAGCGLLAVTALAVVATLRIRGRAPCAIAALVVAAATIVLLAECLSLFDALTRPAILLGQVVLAGAALATWHVCGRPRLPAVARPTLRTLVDAARAHPAVAVLTGLVAVAFVIELYLALTVAPSNWDSMTYHLSRVDYWLQNHSATQWSGGSIRQLHSPPNAELLVAWTLLIRGSDQLAGLVQWLALVGTGAAIFSTCRLIAFPIAGSVFAAGCFVALPQPILQATTTQNDLVTALFVTSAIVFAIRTLRDRSRGDMIIAATSVGLAIGTKGTALIAIPSFVLVVGYAWWRYRPSHRFVAIACGVVVCGVVAFGAFNYVQNLRNTSTLFGPIKHMVERTSPIASNLGRVMWTFADAPGTTAPWLELALRRPFQRAFGELTHPRFDLAIKTGTHEDTSAFGLTGLLVLLPLIVVTAIRPRAPPWHRMFALAGLAYVLAFAITNEWNPWIGRVLVPGVAIGAPLLASVALRPWLCGTTLTLVIAGLVPSVLTNEMKPLLVPVGTKSVRQLNRLRQETIIRPDIYALMTELNKRVDPAAPLGFVGDEDSWDYPLFGKHRERHVLRLQAATQVNVAFMASAGLVGVVYANTAPPEPWLVSHKIGTDYYLVLTADQIAR